MKHTLLLSFILSCVGISNAEDPFKIYAPSRSTNKLSIIQAKETGKGLQLELKEQIDLGFMGTAIASHPEKPLLYIGVSGRAMKDKPPGSAPAAVVTLNKDGSYAEHKDIEFPHSCAYLSLDQTNRFLLSASYFSGKVAVHPLDEKGIPGKPTTKIESPFPFAHCILTSPDNKFVYIPFVKQHNALHQYRFDDKAGTLTPLKPLDAKPPEGTGPRHTAHHPTMPFVYFSNEQHVGVSVYKRNKSGALEIVQVCDAIDPDRSKDGLSSSDILITPDGRFLYAGIRGHRQDFDRIAAYRVKESGEVELIGLTEADKIPWGLTLSPSAKYLLVSAHSGGTITAFKIGEDGTLTKAGALACDEGIADLVTR